MADPRARILITAEDKASAALKRVRAETDRLGTAVKALAVALPVAGFVAATRSALNYADSITDASERTAFSIKGLQELKFAAQQNGVAFAELEGGLARFTKRLGLARMGTGAASDTYKKLGIDLGQTNERVFKQVVDVLGSMEDETNRLALATRLFGDDAQRLGVVFKDGNRGLQEYAEKAADLGLILSDDLVRGASDANDQLDIMQQVVKAQLTRGLVELAPLITSIGNAFADAAPKVAGFFQSFGDPEDMGLEALSQSLDNTYGRIQELQSRLKRAREIAAGNVRVTSRERFGMLLGNFDVDELEAQLTEAQDRYSRLEARLQFFIDEQRNPPKPTPSKPIDLGGLFGTGSSAKSGKSAEQKAADEYARSLQTLRDQLDPASAEARKLEESIALLNRAFFAEGDLGPAEYDYLMQQLTTNTEALREAEKKLADDRAKAFDLIKGLDPGSTYRDQIAEVQRLRDTFPELSDTLAEVELELQAKWDEIGKDAKGTADEAKEAWQGLGPIMSSAFEDAVVAGAKFSDVIKGLEADLIRLFTRNLVTKPLETFFSPGSGGGDFLSSIFGGARAGGGPVAGGRAYLVGEDGPELFMPRGSGEIIPAKQTRNMTGSQMVTININGVSDYESFRRNDTQLRRAAQRALAGA